MLAASFAALAEDARGLLERMERVLATRNYQGTFVHEHDGQTETMKIVHRAENGDFAERVVSLDGSRREAVQRDGELRAYFPDQSVVLVEGGPKGGLLLSGLAGLDNASEQIYRMSEEAPTRISGRETRVIAVEPQDDLRYGYRVWIDAASAMPLKTESHTGAGRVVEQLVFTELTLPAHIADSALQPAAATRQYRLLRHTEASGTAASPGADTTWDAAELPAGFRLIGNSTQFLGDGRKSVTHLVFSDGLASVSVFVEPQSPLAAGRDAAPATALMTNMGSSTALTTEVDGHKITTIGEVPPNCVRAITRSLRVGFAPAARTMRNGRP
ncbi:MAG TPA: MucB/RseB C-terminal domain-containing protein [Steroidobacteraceae bacterium]|nr:MucB/RseB C-terminal domain-containing protein [Steroidobacteraceae bacterium]